MRKRSRVKIKAARALRKGQTLAEELLWDRLRTKQLSGMKVRRQHILRGFIVDFYCPEIKLAIELDGSIHKSQKEADKERQNILESLGVRFLRFTNKDVINNMGNVIETINSFKSEKIPLSCRAGEGMGERS
jgi:very-short-patch-repair endonuclease